MKLRKGYICSETSGSKTATIVLFAGILLLLFSSSGSGAENTLSLSTEGPSFLARGKLRGYGLGVTRNRKGEYGLGLSLSKTLMPAPDNWDYQPFLAGLVSPDKEANWNTITAGLAASYFDYRIGGWALSSDSIAWIRPSSYRFSSTGSFTIGNIGLIYELGLSGLGGERDFWFPKMKGTEFTHLYRKKLENFTCLRDNYFLFAGSKSLSLWGERLSWNQGISLDPREENPGLELVSHFNYMGSSVSLALGNLRLERWSILLELGRLALGYISSGDYISRRRLLFGYRGDFEVDLELVTSDGKPGRFFNLVLRW